MATAIPICSTTWIPEDDLLLKNAVEVNKLINYVLNMCLILELSFQLLLIRN